MFFPFSSNVKTENKLGNTNCLNTFYQGIRSQIINIKGGRKFYVSQDSLTIYVMVTDTVYSVLVNLHFTLCPK